MNYQQYLELSRDEKQGLLAQLTAHFGFAVLCYEVLDDVSLTPNMALKGKELEVELMRSAIHRQAVMDVFERVPGWTAIKDITE